MEWFIMPATFFHQIRDWFRDFRLDESEALLSRGSENMYVNIVLFLQNRIIETLPNSI